MSYQELFVSIFRYFKIPSNTLNKHLKYKFMYLPTKSTQINGFKLGFSG